MDAPFGGFFVTAHPCEGFAMPGCRFQAKTLFASMILPEMKPSQGLDQQLRFLKVYH
jgi:hypothetical protein